MKGPNTKESGSFYRKRGNELERALVALFNDKENLLQFKKGKLEEGIFTLILGRLLEDYKIPIRNVSELSATNNLPQLKNRGHPKTDICITFITKSKKEFPETISIKNTNKNKVSCHDYPAKDFIRVLQCESSNLSYYLNLFQQFPSYRDFEANISEEYSMKEFLELMSNKSKILTEWALKGMHDPQSLIDPNSQISNYLLLKSDDKIAFYSIDEYIAIIYERDKNRFKVPFSWTYPSKQRGKRIQLKVPIFLTSLSKRQK